jgi:diguanylate cyclase (GGDEF)-like protein/PAS domain S-box-containing protein
MSIRSAFKPADLPSSELPDPTAGGQYHHLFERVLGPVLLVDADATICDANPAAASVLGCTRAALVRSCFDDLLSPAWRERSRAALEQALGGEPVRGHETELVGPGGLSVPVLVDMVGDAWQGQTRAWVVAHTMRFRQLLERRQQLAHTVFDNSTEGIVITDADAKILGVNRAFTAITGYEEAEVVGQNPRLLQSGRQDESFYAAMWSSLTQLSSWQGEIWNRRKSGEAYPEWLNISAVRDSEGRIVNFIGLFSDITSIKASQERLDYLAHHDPLTGLPNRLLFGAQIEQALTRMKRAGTYVAVIYLDLDEFKPVNDRLGHEAGDDVLVEVANRLSRSVRDQDTVARIGGDEFAILLEGIHIRTDTDRSLQQIYNALQDKFRWNSTEFAISASVGVSIAPEDGMDARTLLNAADANLYQAKKRKHRERQL